MLRLVKHDSLFSLDTKPIIWTFVAGREKSSFTKDGNRHFEGCGKRGCGGSMNSRSMHFLATYCMFSLCLCKKNNVSDDEGKEDRRDSEMIQQRACYHTVSCVRFAWRAGQRQRYGAHSNWICQNSPPVNIVPLLGKAAAHDLQRDRWLYLLFCCCCCCCCLCCR